MGIFACAQEILVVTDYADYAVVSDINYHFAKHDNSTVDLYYFLMQIQLLIRILRLMGMLLFFVGSIFLTSCKEHSAQKEVDALVKNLETSSRQQELKREAAKTIIPVEYQGQSLRDPFEIAALIKKNDRQFPNTVLRDIALDSLTLVGTVSHQDERWAIFRANNGKLYRVKEGMRVGIQHALLTQVDKNQVKFKLEIASSPTEAESQEVVIRMQRPKE